MYHGVVPDDYPIESWLLVKNSEFKNQLNHLNKHWEVVHIDAYINEYFQTSKPKAIITFDDGYQNNYSVAYPVLQEFNLPATIFVVTDFIDNKELFWFDKVIFSIQENMLASLDLTTLHPSLGKYRFVSNGRERWNDIEVLLTDLKNLGPSKAEEVAQSILEFVKPDSKHLNFIEPLTKQQIIEMSQSGLIEIGAHTTHHEILTNLSLVEAKQTISRSQQTITKIIGKPPAHFCYPNGDYSEAIINLVQENNFVSAMTVKNDFIIPEKLLNYEIPRLPVSAFDSIDIFKAKVSGLSSFTRNIMSSIRSR